MQLSDFFSENGLLSRKINGFEPRESQRSMADAVSRIIGDGVDYETEQARLLLVEAETGIGKTLAYLIPAILSGRKVVISTATLNLQDQIMNKEVPLLEDIVGDALNVVCLKGRQNYLCLYRWYQHYSEAQMSLVDNDEYSRIRSWLEVTGSGDRAELGWLPDRSPLWHRLSANSSQCLGGDCPEGADCFISRARKEAARADILVVNHHLFFSDLAVRKGGYGEVLPRYEGVIFDEAHHIENVATSFFGRTFSHYQLLDLFSDISRQAEADLDTDMYERVLGAARGVRQRAEEFTSIFPAKLGRYHLDDFIGGLPRDSWQAEIELMATGLKRLADELQGCEAYGEGWATLEKRARELRESLFEVAYPAENKLPGSYVYWYERREKSVSLSATPVDVAPHLEETLYGAVDWCVMTSATLTTGGSFSYVRERLGLGEDVESLRLSSPFDYRDRTLVYVPENSFPEPSSPEYTESACRRAGDLLEVSRGRGLVLCTSFRGMESMAEYLRSRLEYPVLAQGDGSRHTLLERFREEKASVLVAVASFWEGVDVAGESLACVIIDKLPFEVPSDPVIQARVQAITEKGGKPFFDFQVPRAVLTLRQGAGRLMRSAGDWGVIGVLDVRLFIKGYGAIFRKSLPPAPIVRTVEPVAELYQRFDPVESSGVLER